MISVGIISAKNRIGGRAVQTDANISPVNYGGPLLDIDGKVIGICVPINPRSTNPAGGVEWYDSGIGFAIPLAEAGTIIEAMKAGKTIRPAALGVRVKDGEPKKPGVEVLQVVKGSAADKAGLRKGDRILKIGGRSISTATQLRFAMARFIAGQKTTVVIRRDGKNSTQAVTLGAGTMPKPKRKFRRSKRRPKPAPRNDGAGRGKR